MNEEVDVVVVGAGAAGVGVAVALAHLDVDVRVLERDEIGSSFRQWPDEMRFITPSYPSNAFGLPDLNAIAPRTSPGVALDCQQPTGAQYADYLEAIVDHYDITVDTGVSVTDVRPAVERAVAVDGGIVTADGTPEQGFTVEAAGGAVDCEFVVWATGEFDFPRKNVVPGAEACVHNSEVDAWTDHATDGAEYVVIGGFESGIDAAINLVEAGCSVTVLDRGHPWATRHPDPSETLSPYTLQRLEKIRDSERLTLVGGAEVQRVETTAEGFDVVATPVEDDIPESSETPAETGNDGWESHTDGRFSVSTRPILATGFEPTLGPLGELFPTEDGTVELTDRDESPETPGLFLAGPNVAHEGQAFCFIYKFRERFPVVAETIGDRLGVDTGPLEVYRESNMFLEDLSCCEPVDCDC